MSSTNRSNARDNHVSDYYITPSKPIFDLFEAIKHTVCCDMYDNNNNLKNYSYLDPCAGGDKINNMSYPDVLLKLGVNDDNITTIDLRNDSRAKLIMDFTKYEPIEKHDIVVTNPPFNIAEDIIKKALEVVKEGGYVIMLLRLNFFGSKKRKLFWENNMPIVTFVHRERISFTKGATDSIEYMHCVWKKGVNQDYTTLKII